MIAIERRDKVQGQKSKGGVFLLVGVEMAH